MANRKFTMIGKVDKSSEKLKAKRMNDQRAFVMRSGKRLTPAPCGLYRDADPTL